MADTSLIKQSNTFKRRITAVLPMLALLVVLVIFWWLKLVGITLAGEAFCGNAEHTHGESCVVKVLVCTERAEESTESDTAVVSETVIDTTYVTDISTERVAEALAGSTETTDITVNIVNIANITEETAVTAETSAEITETTTAAETAAETTALEHVHTDSCYEITYACGYEEHTHVSSCYSDITADVETADDWEATLSGISPNLTMPEKIVEIAKSQLGYTESERNFVVDSDDVRRGYTRYGEWFGNPYGDWSAMFTSFCLRYAGLEDVPVSAGADAMRLGWTEAEIFREDNEYTPVKGDIVFLDKNGNGTADATAIITEISDGAISVIEGDLENAVAETSYEIGNSAIIGYGMTSPGNNLLVTDNGSTMADTDAVIATTQTYSYEVFSKGGTFVVYSRGSDGNYYAFDGNGNAVRIYIDSSGNITSDVADTDTILWSFTLSGGTDSYLIQNISSKRYMHAYPDNGTGVTTAGAYPSTLIEATGGVRIRSNTEYARLSVSDGKYVMTQTQSQAALYSFGKAPTRYAVWLDGTNGGLMGLGGSPNSSYTVMEGTTVKLPEEWQAPDKYAYVLHGWFDIKNNKYYKPGTEITVNESLVLYADWWADSYDVGQYNELVSDTVSTNSFITTKVFDYNSLFNLHSITPSISASLAGHSETWSMVASGTVPYKNGETYNFVFCDYDVDGDISYAAGRDINNVNRSQITEGIYTDRLGNLLFSTDNLYDPDTGEGVLGKKYLGEADHLFHYDSDPNSPNRGYYYYDSKLNAASYNQSDECFYVYDYLERTSDSEKDGGAGAYSDFLPFNSPYVNTNGKTVVNYTSDGQNGEYAGTTHYQYDAKYDGEPNYNSVNNVGTNYWFGMSIDVNFYLPNDSGETDAAGNYGNLDLYGNHMQFKFSGDDDVWIFVDGELVLDIGGVHGIETGDINFSTGVVTVITDNTTGEISTKTVDFSAGEHVLTIYYLERGSSQSNCAIYFNLTPRFNFTIQKEDVLIRELLNGAEFTVYSDLECTVPAELWHSEESYRNGENPVNVFTIVDGTTTLWGLSPGKTYYIKETKPPDEAGYSTSYGIICVSLDYKGEATYTVEIVEDTDENGDPIEISKGYTVHGFRIDEETQEAFLVITNARNWVTDVTTVQTVKEWADSADHTADAVTVYMTVTEQDGTVRRIREIELNEQNGWRYTWTNLPKYWSDGTTEIVYGIEEAYIEGYYGSIEKVDKIEITSSGWDSAYDFVDGETYILGTDSGYLSTVSSTGTTATLTWVDEETAKTSSLALWTAAIDSSNNVKFTNGEGYVLTFRYARQQTGRYFYATKSSSNYQYMTYNESTLNLYYVYNGTNYYFGAIGTNGNVSAANQSSALTFVPKTNKTVTTEEAVTGYGYKITNTPLDVTTSLTVHKAWDLGMATGVSYDKLQATVRLYANGIDTGRTVTLDLKSGWTDTFSGLPYTDTDGNVIVYSVEESWDTDDWTPSYSEVSASDSVPPTYEVTVTNTYKSGYGAELPSTGGYGQLPWILGGEAIALSSVVCGYVLRRKRERRSNS